jgi:hypothetical protein
VTGGDLINDGLLDITKTGFALPLEILANRAPQALLHDVVSVQK